MPIPKRVFLVSIVSIIVCLALSVSACGNQSPSAEQVKSSEAAGAIPTVTRNLTTAIPAATKLPDIPATATATSSVGSSLTVKPGVKTGTQERWLNAVPCRAPCWENITPGKNTPEEALELLKKIPGVTGIEKSPEHPIATKPVAIYWSFLSNTEAYGSIVYHQESSPSIIEYIKLPVTSYKLRAVSKLYGEPSHIMAMLEFDELGRTVTGYNLYLVYLDQGLMLANKFSKIPDITSDTDFPEIYFFAPGLPGLSKIYGPRPELMVEWQGFKGFNYYCRRSTEAGTGNCDSVLNS